MTKWAYGCYLSSPVSGKWLLTMRDPAALLPHRLGIAPFLRIQCSRVFFMGKWKAATILLLVLRGSKYYAWGRVLAVGLCVHSWRSFRFSPLLPRECETNNVLAVCDPALLWPHRLDLASFLRIQACMRLPLGGKQLSICSL